MEERPSTVIYESSQEMKVLRDLSNGLLLITPDQQTNIRKLESKCTKLEATVHLRQPRSSF